MAEIASATIARYCIKRLHTLAINHWQISLQLCYPPPSRRASRQLILNYFYYSTALVHSLMPDLE